MTISKEVLIFDVESHDKENPIIIQAAWQAVKIESSKVIPGESFNAYYNPGQPITIGAMATHHIIDEDLVDCPPSTDFKLPEETKYMIGHKVDFDWEAAGSPEHIKKIDTLVLAALLWPECDSHSQSALAYYLMDKEEARAFTKGAHSAEVDIIICKKILSFILDKVPNIQSVEDLYHLSEYAKTPKIMPFGKHKGLPMYAVEKGWKDWYCKLPDADPLIVKALRMTKDEHEYLHPLLEGVNINNSLKMDDSKLKPKI